MSTKDLQDFIYDYAETRAFSLGHPVAPKPTPDGRHVIFLRGEARNTRLGLFIHALDTGTTAPLVTPAELTGSASEQLSAEERARRERQRITVTGFTSFKLSADGDLVVLPCAGRVFVFRRSNRTAIEVGSGLIDPTLSPDGTKLAYVRGHDVFVTQLQSGREWPVTSGGQPLITHGTAEFVAQEEMGRMFGFVWSPDSRAIAYQQTDTSGVEELLIADPARPERPAERFRYPRAGRSNAVVKLFVAPVDRSREPVQVRWDADRFPYLAHFTWQPGGPLTLLVQSRDQKSQQLLTANASGETAVLLEEHDPAWLNIDVGMPKWLPSGELVWTSEASGQWQATLYSADGVKLRELHEPALGLQKIVSVDAEQRRVFALASPDPRGAMLYELPLDGGAPRLLLADSSARTVSFNTTHTVLVDATASSDVWKSTHVYRVADGTRLATLESKSATPKIVPQVEWREVQLEARRHYAVVIRPSHFRSGDTYPVILSVYGGPHHNTVVGMREAYFREQWLAEHGYIVVASDNRGTPGRGRDWERAIMGDLGDIALGDQVAVLRALGHELPELDLGKVGVFGWSFGGYMAALSVLRRPDVFQSAVAGAPVVDWRDYDTHYTERYLNLPSENPAGYRNSSLLTWAARLDRPLLLIHGTADDNVFFFHTLKLSDALTRAGKPHTVLPLLGFTHMVPEPEMASRMWQRIVTHFDATLKA